MKIVILSTTYNKETNSHYYFCKFGENRKRRISEKRYNYIDSFAKRKDSMFTKVKGNKVLNEKSVYLDFSDYHYIMTA